MKEEEISFKSLTNLQLDALKEIYIESRLTQMSEIELRKCAREVLELQVQGTVGNEEEKEVWKDMKSHFADDFLRKIKEVIKAKGSKEISLDNEQEDFKKRLELLEQRKQEESQKTEDMWDDE